MKDGALKSNATLHDAVRVLETVKKTIAVVIDEENRLLGTISDGDIRRALLADLSLTSSVVDAMNKNPMSADVNTAETYLLDLLKSRNLEAIPLIDSDGCFNRIAYIGDLAPEASFDKAEGFFGAVIMAGGEGRRLSPLTEKKPKPMLEVGGMPLLERQVRRMARVGIKQVFIAVNHLSDVIMNHFGDGEGFGVSIKYLQENKKLGTGGALSLLPEKPDAPLIVVNGDVLTTSDYGHLLDFHYKSKAFMTIAVVDYYLEVPFGVITSEKDRVVSLKEKPSQRFLCNAGIYVLSPEAWGYIPQNQVYDMIDLIQRCLKEDKKVCVFPVHEYWTDIGTLDELENARKTVQELGKDFF